MSHEIDELAPGIHAAAFAREDAWHKLGTTVTSEMTAAGALRHAHLAGWDVRKIPLTATEVTNDGVSSLEVPDRFATVRTNPVTGAVEYLGTVGTYYRPIQNEALIDLLDALIDESGAHFDTAGSLRKGREVFVSMKMPQHLMIGGSDQIDLNLVALNSHDGSSAFRFLVTPVRVVCANTQAAAIREAKSSFSIRHTLNSGHNLQEAREALGLTFKYVEAFDAAAESMAARNVTARWFDKYAEQLFGEPNAEKANKHSQALMSLWRNSDTLEGIRGTRWGAYQAVTEYFDHYAPANGADKDAARAIRTLTSGAIENKKVQAFQLANA